jgi:hypothetical protein
MAEKPNPFEVLGLNPRLDVRALTAALQERARRARPEEKAELQKFWRELTQRHADRVRWALLAHPCDGDATVEFEALRQTVASVFEPGPLPPMVPTIEDALVLPDDATTTRKLIEPPIFEPFDIATGDTGGT